MSGVTSHYDVGSLVVVSTNPPFQTPAGVVTDPTSIYFEWQVTSPLGVASAQTVWQYGGAGSVVRDSVGTYHVNLDTTGTPGLWSYRWRGTGALQAVFDGSFYVDLSPMP